MKSGLNDGFFEFLNCFSEEICRRFDQGGIFFASNVVKSIKKIERIEMKILCFYELDWELDYLKKQLADFQIHFVKGTTQNSPTIDKDADILCLFVDSPVDKHLMESLSSLKLIATRSTGFNHIDRSAAQQLNVKICGVPAYGKNAVAEYAFGLMIMVMRKLYEAYSRIRDNNFSRVDLCGTDLSGKTLGVVGTGDIGSNVVKIGAAFGMNVCAFDLKPNQELVDKTGCVYVSLEELLRQSDVITLHVPYNTGTHHLINKKNIMTCKKGSYLINTARGAIVETAAIVKGLKEGVLAGAGLDVLEEEGEMDHEVSLLLEEHPQAIQLQTLLSNHYLIEHPQVIVTAHNAFNSYEARKRILDCTIDNIKAFVAGKLKNIIS
ncbi:MAG: Glyoxylate reductase (Glycolate reductase) [candidate division TM6 bacterium GW2011_GWE2_36_25]|nr:MAG: Glyoxylate reductase (Glycolate reductase) [candidate division TM6 bacterium GW2011_GWF2_36_131]KKQ03546.1 MAG: Glyoxylate reductase (Glycolate reductase) [candidate division TM6 bacterium GW2011_GWE2_36_25]KKQ20179.1 MAG: Glyoxylate reductase (Glycolate reductase) [candidate division TM6 bacterium GW2011_GWA2_36_9]